MTTRPWDRPSVRVFVLTTMALYHDWASLKVLVHEYYLNQRTESLRFVLVNRKGSCDERNLICRIGLGLKQGLRANIVIKLIFFLGNASSYQIVIHLIYELEPLYTGEMATALLLIAWLPWPGHSEISSLRDWPKNFAHWLSDKWIWSLLSLPQLWGQPWENVNRLATCQSDAPNRFQNSIFDSPPPEIWKLRLLSRGFINLCWHMGRLKICSHDHRQFRYMPIMVCHARFHPVHKHIRPHHAAWQLQLLLSSWKPIAHEESV